jgi:DNA polymerase-3 subunit chi
VLPILLEKCCERGWNVVVQAGSRERCEALDTQLWTYSPGSFLPHSAQIDDFVADQPIWLTDQSDNPNGAQVRFLVDRAVPPQLDAYQRAVFIFDGNDPDAVADARVHWKQMNSAGHEVTYWQQSERGGWEKKN